MTNRGWVLLTLFLMGCSKTSGTAALPSTVNKSIEYVAVDGRLDGNEMATVGKLFRMCQQVPDDEEAAAAFQNLMIEWDAVDSPKVQERLKTQGDYWVPLPMPTYCAQFWTDGKRVRFAILKNHLPGPNESKFDADGRTTLDIHTRLEKWLGRKVH